MRVPAPDLVNNLTNTTGYKQAAQLTRTLLKDHCCACHAADDHQLTLPAMATVTAAFGAADNHSAALQMYK
jgi:hypothetical protein